MWTKVAEGGSLTSLQALVDEQRMNKGDQLKVEMSCPGWDWLFNIAGAKWLFEQVAPDGYLVRKVWGSGGKGYVLMEADPAWLVAAILFIGRHWLAVTIAGFVLTALISNVVVSAKIISKATRPELWALVLGGAGLLILLARSKR